jgi:polyhydroxyalkanoate synthesis regulator phasin
MSNPLLQAFFVGRAVAEVVNERLEVALTDALSELGKFDAEAREQMRQFTEEVLERANRAAEAANTGQTTASGEETGDLQANIDELRAEIALLRNELQRYRSSSV